MNTYAEAVEFLYSQLPMFQRVGGAAYKNDLANTEALCEALGHPERAFKCVHIAGTNGKGSTASALASVFQACGYQTGLFTSPHLKDFRERIRIDGTMVEKDFVVDFLNRHHSVIDRLKPSFFELTTAMAFAYFRNHPVDIAILEVGMGGRLDSTNVVIPELAVITSIGMDHQQFLGDTLAAIAGEKGGIIKQSVPVVVGENEPEVTAVLQRMAHDRGAKYVEATEDTPSMPTDLKGVYQIENMRTVGLAIDQLRLMGWDLPEANVSKGLLSVAKNTGLRGRWETLSHHPRVIADVAHNEEGVALVAQMLAGENYRTLHVVWGMVADKDAARILSLLPEWATYYWCRPDVPRGREVGQLSSEGEKHGLKGTPYPSVTEALRAAKNAAQREDLIFVGGSLFVVGEVL